MTSISDMPSIRANDFVAIVDQYKIADHVGSVSPHPNYVDLASTTTREFELEKKESWRTYGVALGALAKRLFDGLLPTYSSFAGDFNIPDQDRDMVRAAYCHLLAAKLLNAHLCPESPSQQ